MGKLNILVITTTVCCYLHVSQSSTAPQVIYGYEDEKKNLVNNWSFEEIFDKDNDWRVYSADHEVINDTSNAYTGDRYVRIYNRTSSKYAGLKYYFKNLKAHNLYYMSIFLKLENPPGHPTGSKAFYSVLLSCFAGTKRKKIAHFSMVRGSSIWRQLGGDFVPNVDMPTCRFALEVTNRDVDYYIDTVSLIHIPFDPHWKRRCDVEIGKIRTNLITVSMSIPSQLKPYCKMSVLVEQTDRDFKLGSVVKADPFRGTSNFSKEYRDFYFKHFNMGGFENAMKWKGMEKTKNRVKYNRINSTIELWNSKGFPVRGHAIVWSVLESNPAWVQSLTGTALRNAVNHRIDYMGNQFKGRVDHWDVVNEYLHGRFFANRIPDPEFPEYAFKRLHAIDPDAKLFVNDYQAMRSPDMTSALADMTYTMRANNAPVHGVGCQSHIRGLIQPERIKKRYEILAATGLPVFATEASVHFANVTQRAWQLEAFLYMSMCTAGVGGVVFWEFSNHSVPRENIAFEPETWSMFDDPDFTPNEAGLKYLALLKKWTTKKMLKASSRKLKKTVSGFHGIYRARVFYKGQEIKSVPFRLRAGRDIEVTIPLSWAELEDKYDGDTTDCDPYNKTKEYKDPAKPQNKGAG